MTDFDPQQDPHLSEQEDALRVAREVVGDGSDHETSEDRAEYLEMLHGVADGYLESRRGEMADPLGQDPDNPVSRMRQAQEAARRILGEESGEK